MNQCYKCKYRRPIAGDSHSSCSLWPDSMPENFKIDAEPRGIKSGWFMWPFNFDPVWLKECSGFSPIQTEGEQTNA